MEAAVSGARRGSLHSASLLEAGTTVAGYRIDSFLAQGGMGVVYRATQIGLDRPVALKLIAPEHKLKP